MTGRGLVRAVVGIGFLAALTVGPAVSASAGDPTSIAFTADSTQTVAYGTNWVMTIQVSGKPFYQADEASSATVDVLIKGQPGYFATGIPVAENGEAFFAQPSSKPFLPAGTYTVSAVFVPGPGAYLSGSQTSTPATLTITPVSVAGAFTVNKVLVNNKPALKVVATASAKGSDSGVPDGAWTISAKTASGTVAFSKVISTAKNPASPVSVTLGQKLPPGNYTIAASYAPAPNVAGGYQVSNGAPQTVALDAPSVLATLQTPFAAPSWALIAVGVGFLLLIATGIVLLVTRRAKPVPNDPATPESIQPVEG